MVPTPSLPSANYTFSQLPEVSMPRCSIRRPSTYKTTLNAGMLYPVFCDEALPGDTFTLDTSVICRLTTPLVPFMDNLVMDFQFFFIPNRLLWRHWSEFCGEQEQPGVIKNYTVPSIVCPEKGFEVGSLADYFGIPTGVKFASHDVQALPFRAYNLVWDEWYRDENVQSRVFDYNIGDDDDSYDTLYKLLPRGKRKDYFTSALPWPQKGAAVSVDAQIMGNGRALGLRTFSQDSLYLANSSSSSPQTTLAFSLHAPSDGQLKGSPAFGTSGYNSNFVGVSTDPEKSGMTASIGINALRQAIALQRLLELDARGGTRYTEILRAHFGVTSPDARLQRPELLGSFSVPLYLHTVPQSSGTGTTSETPQGNLSAFGLANDTNRAFQKSFTEHGIVLGLVSIRSDLTYQQGLPRMWSRSTRYDYYWPALSTLGEQAILNKEIYAQGASVVDSSNVRVDNKVFGYQERWSEYKYGYSKITGQLRSTFAQSLDYWHLAQKFDELPTLSPKFIEENPPLQRVLAVTDAPQFIFDAYFDLNCIRPMPLYCVPGLVNHF